MKDHEWRKHAVGEVAGGTMLYGLLLQGLLVISSVTLPDVMSIEMMILVTSAQLQSPRYFATGAASSTFDTGWVTTRPSQVAPTNFGSSKLA